MKLPLALSALALCACEPQVICTDIAMASVMVRVEDTDGAAVPDLTVSYQAGGDVTDCDPAGTDNGKDFVCGYEVDGVITVTASAPGFDDATDTVTIVKDADGCHVIGQSITLTLTPVAG